MPRARRTRAAKASAKAAKAAGARTPRTRRRWCSRRRRGPESQRRGRERQKEIQQAPLGCTRMHSQKWLKRLTPQEDTRKSPRKNLNSVYCVSAEVFFVLHCSLRKRPPVPWSCSRRPGVERTFRLSESFGGSHQDLSRISRGSLASCHTFHCCSMLVLRALYACLSPVFA